MYRFSPWSYRVRLSVVSCFLSQIVPLLGSGDGNMEDILLEEKITPGILDKIPIYIAEINYDNVTLATFGNIIPKKYYEKHPESVEWMPDCHLYYTIIFTDIDANPKWPRRERQLWIVGNILGGAWNSGENITEYGILEPAESSGKHRVLIVIYEQGNKIDFKEPVITKRDDERRDNFSTLEFVRKYNMDHPNAANYFSIKYEGRIK
nr:PREDICTED: putative odorant-binding protein A5 isoform X1 [Bemisia tabaci]